MGQVSPAVPASRRCANVRRRRKQVLQNTIVKLLERLASVLGGIIGAILAIYGYFRWAGLLSFEHYFHEIRQIELIARGVHTDPAAPSSKPELLMYLRNRLSDPQCRHCRVRPRPFAGGEFDSEHLYAYQGYE